MITANSLKLHPAFREKFGDLCPLILQLVTHMARSYNTETYLRAKADFEQRQKVQPTKEIFPEMPPIDSEDMQNLDFFGFVSTYVLFSSESRLVDKIKFLYDSALVNAVPKSKSFSAQIAQNFSLGCHGKSLGELQSQLKEVPGMDSNELSLQHFTDSIVSDVKLRNQLVKPLFTDSSQ